MSSQAMYNIFFLNYHRLKDGGVVILFKPTEVFVSDVCCCCFSQFLIIVAHHLNRTISVGAPSGAILFAATGRSYCEVFCLRFKSGGLHHLFKRH